MFSAARQNPVCATFRIHRRNHHESFNNKTVNLWGQWWKKLLKQFKYDTCIYYLVYRPRTSILEVPHEFKSRRGSHGNSALWQGALSSLLSLSKETLSRRSRTCIGESHPMHVKEPISLLAKSREKSRWSGQTNKRKRVYDVDPSLFTLEGYTYCV